MDSEHSPTVTSVAPKRGRKGRSPKGKQAIDQARNLSSSSVGEGANNSVESFGSGDRNGLSESVKVSSKHNDNGDLSGVTTGDAPSCSSSKRNDNLLMPPPAQPDNSDCCHSQKMEVEWEGAKDHEHLIDGFSIFCFTSEDEVQVK